MDPTQHRREQAVIIGDIVGSRNFTDQQQLMRRVTQALTWVNRRLQALQPLALSVGDEFQAAYATIQDALTATVLLQLRLCRNPELRFGVGWGEVVETVAKPGPGGQSGTAWWRARDAIDAAKAHEIARAWPRTVRTRVCSAESHTDGPLNAFLICRDHILAGMDEKDARITLGLFQQETQSELARELGLGQSNVSRRQADKGPAAIFRAHEQFGDVIR